MKVTSKIRSASEPAQISDAARNAAAVIAAARKAGDSLPRPYRYTKTGEQA